MPYVNRVDKNAADNRRYHAKKDDPAWYEARKERINRRRRLTNWDRPKSLPKAACEQKMPEDRNHAFSKVIHADCGHDAADYLCWEREGKTYCEMCFAIRLQTPLGRAYEEWFVRG